MLNGRRRSALLALLLLLTPSLGQAATPAYVWVHPVVTDMAAMTPLYDARLKEIDFNRITGRTGWVRLGMSPANLERVLAVLALAQARGSAGCDTIPAYPQRAPVWAVTLIDTTASGKLHVRSTSHVSVEAARCRAREALAALGPNPPRDLFAGLTQMTGMGGSPPPAFDPANSPGYQVIQRLNIRDQLIKDAGWAGHPRDWDRIAFDVWTARAPGGRGVRLSTRAYPALADDPMAPTWIHVSRSTLRSVIERFLGRREIEIASHYPREDAVRNGVNGWIGATEWSDAAPVPAPVFASHVLPSEAESMARELVDFLFWRDWGASGRIKDALALGAKPKAKSLPPLKYTGPPPLAITIVPTTGGDFAMPMYLTSQRAMLLPPQPFWGKRGIGPDPDLPRRGNWFTGNEGDADLAASAALLEQAAAPGDAPCDPLPQDPAWPPTWHVRIAWTARRRTSNVSSTCRRASCAAAPSNATTRSRTRATTCVARCKP
jgi:hypothetical protein